MKPENNKIKMNKQLTDKLAKMRKMKSVFEALAAKLKSADELLKNSNKQLCYVEQRTPANIIINVDERGKIIFWNNTAKNVFGYSSNEIMGKPLTSIIPEYDVVKAMF